MQLTVIQSVYFRNPIIPSILIKNLSILFNCNINFQYIIYNDNGDQNIITDIILYIDKLKNEYKEQYKKFRNAFEYIYSDVNYGKQIDNGALVGAIPYIKGDLIHFFSQDDIFTTSFYNEAIEKLSNPELYFYASNAYKINNKFEVLNVIINPLYEMDCYNPLKIFAEWFGTFPSNYDVTRAENKFISSGVIYKKKLHDLIGTFDLENFIGNASFEYWARILFNEYKGFYNKNANWFCMESEYSIGNHVVDNKKINNYWIPLATNKIKLKYSELVKNNKYKFNNL